MVHTDYSLLEYECAAVYRIAQADCVACIR